MTQLMSDNKQKINTYEFFLSQVSEPILSKNSLTVLEKRYLRPLETPKELFARVAWAVAQPEELHLRTAFATLVYDRISSGKFMFNSPALFNLGTNNGLGASACYVLVPEDSLESIMDVCKNLALIQKAGGGVGYNFSKLRPRGSMVSTCAATTDGPLPFIDMYCAATNAIQQGAKRRGAQMGLLSIYHPDVLDFIKAKSDLNRWQNMNVSLLVDNKWMDTLRNNPETPHKVSHPKWGEGYLVKDQGSGKYHAITWKKDLKELEACQQSKGLILTVGQLFEEICTRAWSTGEPGLIFEDHVNGDWMFKKTGINKIEGTNPCVTGDTKILTVNGPVSIKDLVSGNCIECRGIGNLGQNDHNGNDITCDKCNGTGRADSKPIKLHTWDPDSKLPCIRTGYHPRLTGWQSELLEIEFDSGLKLRCTPNHNLRTFRGDKIQAKDITVGQSVRAFSVSKHRDGHLRAHGWAANKTMHQWVHRMVWEDVNGEIPEGYVIHHKDHNPQNNDISNLELLSAYDHQSEHYDQRFANGFHNAKMNRNLVENNHKVVSIKEAGREDVYNITVEDTHTYIIVDPSYKGEGADGIWSGIVSCNCGEQPLENGGNCTLASINLSAYFDEHTQAIDYKNLEHDTKLMQRALDNIVEINKFPVELVTKQNLNTRRIGGGVMGWADLLFKMNLPYNSGIARDLARTVMANISLWSVQISKVLAKARGSFLDHNKSDYDVPIRNAYRNTIAPTGTISIISDCSGGIEPIFSLAFTREVLQDANGNRTIMHEVNKEFSKALTSFLNFFSSISEEEDKIDIKKTYDDIVEYAAANGTLSGYTNVFTDTKRWKYLCDIFVTAKDIEPTDHILMQAAWQKHVDTAISKTINLRKESSIGDVKHAYKLAYDTGCKGITVYRDGSRDGVAGMVQPMQLAKKEDSPIKKSEHETIKEITDEDIVASIPERVELPAFHDLKWQLPKNISPADPIDVYESLKIKQITPMGNLHVVLVVDSNKKPLELFAQISKAGEQPAADLEAICRLASVFLRNGGSLDEVIKQVEHIGSSELTPSKDGQVKSLPDGLGLALKKIRKSLTCYKFDSTIKLNVQTDSNVKLNVQDNRKLDVMYKKVCPSCSSHLVRQEGCSVCSNPSCGFSKC